MGSEAHTQPEGSPQVGLIPRFIEDFFRKMQEKKQDSDEASNSGDRNTGDSPCSDVPCAPILLEYHIKASFLEVYGEDVYDLLDSERRSLPLREDSSGGVVIAGLTDKVITCPKEALHVLHEGTNNRTTAATLMNLTSSRSHAVFTIYLTQKTRGSDQVDLVSTSKFTFVDLAGSERMKKTGAEGERAREGIKINEGLLALGNVINALADDERLAKEKTIHVPYRQSKLTRLLQDALGGNSQTLFLACVSPSDTNVSETLSTLRYANRARNIRNAPTKNLDPTSTELQRLKDLTRVLQCELVKAKFQGGDGDKENDPATIGKVDDILYKRPEVEEYLRMIHRTVSEQSGATDVPAYSFKHLSAVPASGVHNNSLKIEGPLPTIEATPFKGSERIDESFHIDVNPDEDMAILDRLLELQHHDHEFDKAKKRDDESLKKMDGELQREEALLLQLRESLKAYHSLKQKYEELMMEVQQLETEKSSLAEQLEKATADPSVGNSAAIKRQLERVELSLNRARRETLSHRQKYKAAEEQARRCQVLERKIATLKQAKTNLLKKQKETAARYKEVTEAKTKELLALKRKEKSANARLSKMKIEIQQHKTHLEKRKQYCTKLSDKLKQTEAHLMKLLSMRQRDLVERASIIGKKGPLLESVLERNSEKNSDHETRMEKLSSEDLKTIQFISDKLMTEKIDHAIRLSTYKERVAEYSETMRLVVAHVKELKDRRELMETDSHDVGDVEEIEETVAELEMKLEFLGAEVKEIESLLPDEQKMSRDEEAVRKLMKKLPALALRKLIFNSYEKLVESETENRANLEILKRKDAAISSLEIEVDILHAKVESLSQDLSKRHILLESGEDIFSVLKNVQAENEELETRLSRSMSEIDELKQVVDETKDSLRMQKIEAEEAKDELVLVKASLDQMNGVVEAESTLSELQRLWSALGFDQSERESIRDEILHSVSHTCQRHKDEATNLMSETKNEIAELQSKLAMMQAALGISISLETSHGGLLAEAKELRRQVQNLVPTFESANARRERIISEMVKLCSALDISKDELPANLKVLMEQLDSTHSTKMTIARLRRASIMENVQSMVDSITTDMGEKCEAKDDKSIRDKYALPEASLEEGFLDKCETDIAALRVKKSEMLVMNRERMQSIQELTKRLHSGTQELFDLVNAELKARDGNLPTWWEAERAMGILKKAVSFCRFDDFDSSDTRFITSIQKALENVAGTREQVSTVLRQIVEKAQQTLLDIVGRELDASEAYASFHDALLKLPSLSQDFSTACITEMEALVLGTEAMTQSEIEALTVVWEALRVSPEERRAFWGDVDKDEEIASREDRFHQLEECLAEGKTEVWISTLLTKGRIVNKELQTKLRKLAAIHREVEKLRSKQDTKSQVLSLDSEIRILNSKLLDFEELQCSKQRLLTKKSGSTSLLKEARFRKQMKAKFESKLSQLASLLRSWEKEEGHPFDATLLSDDVRVLLDHPDQMETWIEKRTQLMPSRTVPTKSTPQKRSFEDGRVPAKSNAISASIRSLPPRKKAATVAAKALKSANDRPIESTAPRRSDRKRKPMHSSENLAQQPEPSTKKKSPVIKRVPKVRRKESATCLPVLKKRNNMFISRANHSPQRNFT
eukprot:CAMPEP_0176013204 /NCGR_PEP_ID=MMETSP0120_2-20121206/6187_1 /TAXON_ID=160619 /ORGANISM="Kryptoperidinium foliaceum, Strain CCMP 1326" /LENGTH=1628 /DNA_ID=CAMNT_0017346107 /DNA_START=393 /DNA_END=5279 /DNA_ORIENTATION=-